MATRPSAPLLSPRRSSRWATKWTVLGSALAVVPLVFRKQPYIAGIFVAVLSSKALYDTLRTEPFYR